MSGHGSEAASSWVRRWSHLVPTGGRVLDVACGRGRHTRWFLRHGHAVTAIDRDPAALDALRAGVADAALTIVAADIEAGPWPLTPAGCAQGFDAVVVTNYLWRPLWPMLLASLAEGGVLLYETFSEDHASVGRPSRPEFLLRHGELLTLCQGLRIVAYEDGWLEPPERFVQRVAAVRLGAPAAGARPRHRLPASSDGADGLPPRG